METAEKSTHISYHLSIFFRTKNLKYLLKAIYLIFVQKRFRELFLGWYHYIFHRPSSVKLENNLLVYRILQEIQEFVEDDDIYSREKLISKFMNAYAVNYIPLDFAWARAESVIESNNILIIGEYGAMKKRILYLNKISCNICNFYENDTNVTHIHAIHNQNNNNFWVTTGDAAKYLDLWEINEFEIKFKKRLKKKFAGYTAISMLDGNCYFGSDFSNRPNYIETLDNLKFFFPKKAYKMFVLKFSKFQERYIISHNRELKYWGDRQTISIFDTYLKRFIFCEYRDNMLTLMKKYSIQYLGYEQTISLDDNST